MTLVVTAVADRVGRRAMLVFGAALMAIAGAVFALSVDPFVLACAAVLGSISPSGKEVGPFLALEQAILPQTTIDRQRTAVFAAYNVVNSFCGALGALAVGIPALFSLPELPGFRWLLGLYIVCSIVMGLLFLVLSPAVETAVTASAPVLKVGIERSRGVVARLGGLFALDAFAGGFVVQSLVAYWFYLRYQADTELLGSIFFGANLLAALSFLAAPAIARRIGLLNTMVFTHLPSNVLLAAVPLMPSLEGAVAMFLARNLLSQMDVPTRQSYTMGVVAEGERAAAAGIFSVARNAGAALAPLFTGPMLANPPAGWLFLTAGGLKVVYDLSIFGWFRHLHPAEEERRPAAMTTP